MKVSARFDFISTGLIVILFCLYFFPFSKAAVVPDSAQYLEFADAILSGKLWQKISPNELSIALAVRTPLYPLLLAATKFFFSDPLNAIVPLQVICAVFTIILCAYALRAVVPCFITALLISLTFLHFDIYYLLVLTEWVAYCGLVILYTLTVVFLAKPSIRGLFVLTLGCSLLTLTRPALIITYALPAALFFFYRRILPLYKSALPSLLGLMPLLLWMSFNFYRFGSFTLTPFAGTNLFGVASIIGEANIYPEDSSDLKYFITSVDSQKKLPRDKVLRSWADYNDFAPIVECYAANIWQTAEAAINQEQWSRTTQNHLMLTYARRVITKYPARYLMWIAANMLRPAGAVIWLAFGLAVVGLIHFKRLWPDPIYTSFALFYLIHLLNMFLCSSLEVLIDRYYLMSLGLLQIALGLTLFKFTRPRTIA